MSYFKNLVAAMVLIFSQAAFSAEETDCSHEHDCEQYRATVSSLIHENAVAWLIQNASSKVEECAKCNRWQEKEKMEKREEFMYKAAEEAGITIGDVEPTGAEPKSRTQRLKSWFSFK